MHVLRTLRLGGTVHSRSLIYKFDLHTSVPSPTEATAHFFEVKSNYCPSTSPLTLRGWVGVSTYASERAWLCTPIKTPSDEHGTGDGEKEKAAQPCFHLSPF